MREILLGGKHPIRPPTVEIEDRQRRLTWRDKRAAAHAYDPCAAAAPQNFAVAVADHDGVICAVTDGRSRDEAVRRVYRWFRDRYKDAPRSGAVAVLSFYPTCGQALMLAQCGASVLFPLVPPKYRGGDQEESLRAAWLGTYTSRLACRTLLHPNIPLI